MKKFITKYLFTAVLLLMAFAVMAPVVQAATAESYMVTFEYDSNACSVKVMVDGKAISPTEEGGKTYHVLKNHQKFEIQVVRKVGYNTSALKDKETGKFLAPSDTAGLLFEPPLSKDISFVIESNPKQYTIQEQGAEGLNHEAVFSEIKYYYDSEETVTLPIPTLAGYDFVGWNISDGDKISFNLNTITGNAVVFPTSSYPATGDVLYAQPIWEGQPQTVTRHDYEYDPTGQTKIPVNNGIAGVTHITQWTEPNGTTNISGLAGNEADADAGASFDEGGYKTYVGYYPFSDYASNSAYYTVLAKVKTDVEANKIYRYYVPITYTLNYEGLEDVSGYPATHVYNTSRSFVDLKPERVGYNFVGWRVYVQKDGVKTDVTASIGNLGLDTIENLTLNAREIAIAQDNENNEITLEAVWSPKTYSITYGWNGADEDKLTFTKVEGYIFNQDAVITDPVRSGYTFKGWELTCGTLTETLNSVNGSVILTASTYTDNITLKAIWEANSYQITFNGNGATTAGLGSLNVVFDSTVDVTALQAALPARIGYTFRGFTLTKDGDDLIFDENGKFLRDVWDIPADTTVYAKWEVNYYLISVNVTGAQVWLNGTLYEGKPLSFAYDSVIKVTVKAENGFKVAAFEGKAVSHLKDYEVSYTVSVAEDTQLDIVVLPVVKLPAFRVDYVNEIFTVDGGIPDGNYRISCGAEALSIKVQGGVIYVGDVKVTQISIPESFFGATVEIMMFGDGIKDTDSDPDAHTLAVRPGFPVLNNHINSIYADTSSVAVEMNPNAPWTYDYEFAISTRNDGTGLVWMSAAQLASDKANVYMFTNLNPGTIYYVYVRVKASENYPHGQENLFQQNTYYEDYLNKKIAELQALMNEVDGEMVKALIEKAIADAKALEKPSATFYEDLEGIYNRAQSEIAPARSQDQKIAELRALRDTLLNSGEYSDAAEQEINSICDAGVDAIKASVTEDEFQARYGEASSKMVAVKITYLVYENMHLTSFAGLMQGTTMFQTRLDNLTSLMGWVDSAIATGKITIAEGVSMTPVQALEALRTKDVMASYTVRLNRNSASVTTFEGIFEIRLLLPEDLRNTEGLVVAYYDQKTGVLEIMDTKREGNDLVFTTNRIADFVILGDPVVKLGGLIGTLGTVLLCQLIAIVYLLIRRSKSAKAMRHYSLMLPVALTIRFLPDSGLTVVAVLGILVVLMQIVLMYLLLSSDIFYRRHRGGYQPAPVARPQAPAKEEIRVPVADQPVEEPLDESEDDSYDAVSAVFLASSANDLLPDDEEEYLPQEEDHSEEYGEEYAEEETEEYSEEYAEEETEGYTEEYTEEEAEDDGYDFIEPAVTSRYSLPDEEENEEAESLEETEETAEESAEGYDWAYDDEGEEIVYDTEAQDEDFAESGFEFSYDESSEDALEEAAEEGSDETEAQMYLPDDVDTDYYGEPDASGERAPAPYFEPDIGAEEESEEESEEPADAKTNDPKQNE